MGINKFFLPQTVFLYCFLCGIEQLLFAHMRIMDGVSLMSDALIQPAAVFKARAMMAAGHGRD
jgi:hypothetical protein